MKKLFCPCCKSELVITHQGRYEDLNEHVSNPNGTPSLKDGYQCPYEYCEANDLGASWIEDGSIYMKPPEGIAWTTAHRIIEKCSTSGMSNALGSWTHFYEGGVKLQKARTKKVLLGKWRFDFIPKMKGSGYPEDQEYQPKKFFYTIEIWKKGKHEGCYTHVIPTYRMVKFCINKFNRDYQNWEKSKNEHSLTECYNEIECLFFVGHKDDRTYAKISSWLVKFLYPNKCKKILQAKSKS